MSGEKTEQPTQKKLRDSAKKGQSYKSRDIIAACILAAGMLFITSMSFKGVINVFSDFITRGDNISPSYAADRLLSLFLGLTLPFVGVCIVATVIPSLLQSKFALAFEAIKIDFASLNPVSGFKKIFSSKTIKEFIKALLYLGVFCVVVFLFYYEYRRILYSLVYAQPSSIANVWLEAGTAIVLLCLASFLLIIIMDGFADYYLYIKELKMEKHEVKQEYKEQEGNPEVKYRRREVHQEILSEQTKGHIDQSDFILANPTHIAIGIYSNPEITPLPFVSVLAKNQVALAVIAYAEKVGTPVVRDIPLARRLFKNAKRFGFIPQDSLEPIMRILKWLKEIEQAHLKEMGEEVEPVEGQIQAAPEDAESAAENATAETPAESDAENSSDDAPEKAADAEDDADKHSPSDPEEKDPPQKDPSA